LAENRQKKLKTWVETIKSERFSTVNNFLCANLFSTFNPSLNSIPGVYYGTINSNGQFDPKLRQRADKNGKKTRETYILELLLYFIHKRLITFEL